MKKKQKKNNITPKQLLFCYEYIANKFNRNIAYKKVYNVRSDEVAKVNASRLLTNANVIKKIKQLTKEYFTPLGYKVQDVLNELAIMGFSDMKDFIIEGKDGVEIKKVKDMGIKSRCIRELEIDNKTITIKDKVIKLQKVKFKLHGKEKSLELLGKHSDIFKIEEEKGEGGRDPSVLLHVEPKDIQGRDAAEIARDYSTLLRGLSKSK
jgi:phage terminase small subunit